MYMQSQLYNIRLIGLIHEMNSKKENSSLYWTVALYLALSTICVTANKLYPKISDVEDVITLGDDVAVENKFFYGVETTDYDQPAVESNEMVHKEDSEICEIG